MIEHSKLPDNPEIAWNKTIIKEVLLKYIEKLCVDTIITFDDYGVSGHLNHVSVYRAMQTMYSKGALPVGTQVRFVSVLLDIILNKMDSSSI